MSIRIKLLRKQYALSLEQLAVMTGLTKSYLSKVERGIANPSISTSLKIAEALGVEVTDLFGKPVEEDMVCLVRKDQGLQVMPDSSLERTIDILAAAMPDKQMQPFIVSPPHAFSDGPQMHDHPGEEFLMVLNGQIEIQFPERTDTLNQGDSIYFRANLPHKIRSLSEDKASALVVISKHQTPDY